MKKIFFRVFAFTLICPLFIACEDISFLDKAPYSHTSPENYYKKLSDFQSAIVGCYDAMSANTVGNVSVDFGTYYLGLPMMLNGGNDEMILSNNPGTNHYTAFGDGSYKSDNTAISKFWTAFFAGIMRCNYVIDRAKKVSFEGSEGVRLNEIVSEARFLRAFYYIHLTELLGGVPINTSPLANPDAPRETLEKVYNQVIIPDLDHAYKTLPNRAAIAGAANKWSAAGYLATVYNYLSACKRYNVGGTLENNEINSFVWVNETQMTNSAKTILEDIYYNSGYKLIDRYDYLFRETTKSFQQQECLFTMECALDIGGDVNPQSTLIFGPGNSGSGGSYGIYRNTQEIYNSYESTGTVDIRRNYNITGNYNAAVTENIEGKTYLTTTTANNFPGKYRISNPSPGAGRTLATNRSGVSYPMIRYADILLQYAEVLYFTGDEPAARNLLSDVRQRALGAGKTIDQLNTAYAKADFIDELLDERKRELCFEFKRRVDLIRFGRLTTVINSLTPSTSGNNVSIAPLQTNWIEYKIWLPIPQVERDLNPNLSQNTGY